MTASPPPAAIPAVLLMGPTASGKTGLSLALHAAVREGRLPFAGAEIISVDSAQVFRGMDIGTAKPDAAIRAQIPHHLVDILDPAESYSAARFAEDALALIAAARRQNRLPILVGGTGLYFRALEQGLSAMPAASPGIRARLAEEGRQHGWPALHARLAAADPLSAEKIKANDPQRITRALEIIELTGISRSAHWAAPKTAGLTGPVVKLVLMPAGRERLHAAIAERFMQMMQAGFLDEVRRLKARGDLHLGLPAMRAVGYRQLWEHLDGVDGLEAAIQRGIIATRQYAKRQLTWLKSEQNVTCLNPQEKATLEIVIAEVLRASQAARPA